MVDKWSSYNPNDPKPRTVMKKAKNHCQMEKCFNFVSYKCTPNVEGAASLFVCERHMPHWRDKYYKIEGAKKSG